MFINQDRRITSDIVIDRPAIHTDEHLNYWSDVWVNENLRDEGILLESFLRFPHDLLEAVQRKRARQFKELLPQQKRVQARVLREEANNQVVLDLNRISSNHDATLGAEADVSHVVLQFNK